nr:class I SAM-dependent methyltransferase [Chryseobacterium angstadtii]
MGCGTGRLLEFATHGVDFSEKMLRIASEKHPEKITAVGEISNIPFDIKFGCIFCFHVIMHQTKEETENFLKECFRKLDNQGFLIFDYPTKTRRKVVSPQEDWHAGNSFNIEEISLLTQNQWNLRSTTGILLFPVHRLPKKLRLFFCPSIFCCAVHFLKSGLPITL